MQQVHLERQGALGDRLTSCLSLRDRSAWLDSVAPEKAAELYVIENNRVKFLTHVYMDFSTCVEIATVDTGVASYVPLGFPFDQLTMKKLPRTETFHE